MSDRGKGAVPTKNTGASEVSTQTASVFTRKLPAMRIPKLPKAAEKPNNTERSVSPAGDWIDSLIIPEKITKKTASSAAPYGVKGSANSEVTGGKVVPATDEAKLSPVLSSTSTSTVTCGGRAGSTGDSSVPTSMKKKKKNKKNGSAKTNTQISGGKATDSNKSGVSPSTKKKGKKKKLKSTAAVETATSTGGATGKAAGKKAKKKKKEASNMGKKGVVVRDTSPKFVPPEKPKKSAGMAAVGAPVRRVCAVETWLSSTPNTVFSHPTGLSLAKPATTNSMRSISESPSCESHVSVTTGSRHTPSAGPSTAQSTFCSTSISQAKSSVQEPMPGKILPGRSSSSSLGSSSTTPPAESLQLQLPPSRATGESLLFGDVIEIESCYEDRGEEVERGKGGKSSHCNIELTQHTPQSGESSTHTPREPSATQEEATGLGVSRQFSQTAAVHSTGRSLPLKRTVSGDSARQLQAKTMTETRTLSLPAQRDSGTVNSTSNSSVVSESGRHPSHTNSSSFPRREPPAPTQVGHLKLPLTSSQQPCTSAAPLVKEEPVSPTLSDRESPLSLSSNGSASTYSLDLGMLKKLQEKIDFQVSKLKVIGLEQQASSAAGVSSATTALTLNSDSSSSATTSDSAGTNTERSGGLNEPFCVDPSPTESPPPPRDQMGPKCDQIEPLSPQPACERRPLASKGSPKSQSFLVGGKVVCTVLQSDGKGSPLSPGTTTVHQSLTSTQCLAKPTPAHKESEREKVVSFHQDSPHTAEDNTPFSAPSTSSSGLNSVNFQTGTKVVATEVGERMVGTQSTSSKATSATDLAPHLESATPLGQSPDQENRECERVSLRLDMPVSSLRSGGSRLSGGAGVATEVGEVEEGGSNAAPCVTVSRVNRQKNRRSSVTGEDRGVKRVRMEMSDQCVRRSSVTGEERGVKRVRMEMSEQCGEVPSAAGDLSAHPPASLETNKASSTILSYMTVRNIA